MQNVDDIKLRNVRHTEPVYLSQKIEIDAGAAEDANQEAPEMPVEEAEAIND